MCTMEYITLPKILIVLVLAGILWYTKRKPGGAKAVSAVPGSDLPAARPAVTKTVRSPEEVYLGLRDGALHKAPEQLFLPDGLKAEEPFGALMEMAVPNDVITLACFADGDAGVYYKTGGGMKGGGSHENVRRAAKQFVALSQRALPRMIKTDAHPLPEADKVRFYVLTPKGTFTTEAPRQALGGAENDLSALFYGGQEVVAQMRQVQEQKTG
jgi:hypothetical protein